MVSIEGGEGTFSCQNVHASGVHKAFCRKYANRLLNVFNRGMKTKPFKEIVRIKKSSSGPTNSANKLSPLKSMRV